MILIYIACSAGVFFGRANVLLAQAPYIHMLKFGKRGEDGDSQKERGGGRRVPSTYPKGCNFYPP